MTPAIFHADDPPGPSGRLMRLRRNLPWMLEMYPGNIVEIGAGYGESTKIFLEMADRFDRRVLVIDPWECHDGVVQHDQFEKDYPYTYERFRANVGEHPRLDVCRFASDRAEAFFALENFGVIAFAMVDGLMDYISVRSDLTWMDDVGSEIILADDFGFRDEVREAVVSYCAAREWDIHHQDGAHEAYITRA